MFLGAGLQVDKGEKASRPCPHPEATKVTRRCCLARMQGKEVSHLSPLSALQANTCNTSFSTSAPPAAQAAILDCAEVPRGKSTDGQSEGTGPP